MILKDRGQIIMRELINKTAESPIRRKMRITLTARTRGREFRY
ncbi:hypothetical protein CDSM653_00428 [Caldanaerobacter subterraneus subsp. pacificus DSM 12653]|uniref:Uncharacterized protein n=1 Tax=Caldanaerobacter subterraneus subsp. pacificus DSM 12653 TaxID=391606 RepID=A0A0F5PPL9_9THEO|nr:hypothetical protein CDSM653_00428 [Caldanaerobacter subterraneus subsp. pacificus DSM 12653]